MSALKTKISELFRGIKLSHCLIALSGSFILAFGLYNIHSVSDVTEGGILGLTLLIHHWTGISPSLSGFIMNITAYIIGWKTLGRKFLVYSFISSFGFSAFYKIFEFFPPLFPSISEMPLIAAVTGALFVGISTGLCVLVGGAPGGDDALAMSIVKLTKMKIQWAYMLCDLVVLALSLTYIPLNKIIYSLLTVTISGQLVGIMQKLKKPSRKNIEDAP